MTRLEANSAVKQRGHCCSVKCDRLTIIETLSSRVQDHSIPSIGLEIATDRGHVQLVENLGIGMLSARNRWPASTAAC